jgi:hypothetical protein
VHYVGHVRADAAFFAAFLTLELICTTSRAALASSGCNAVNAGGFNVSSGGLAKNTIGGFEVGDIVTFVINSNSNGSWILRTDSFANLDSSPIFVTSPSLTRSYTVSGVNQDKTLTQYSGGIGVVASCVAAAPEPTITSISPISGPSTGGTSVTIVGKEFNGVTSVNFGSNGAAFTVNSESSITAISPANNGAVDVTVSSSKGISATNAADQFTYIDEISTPLIAILPRPDPRRRSHPSLLPPAPTTVQRLLGLIPTR